jgi:hypothetical protein
MVRVRIAVDARLSPGALHFEKGKSLSFATRSPVVDVRLARFKGHNCGVRMLLKASAAPFFRVGKRAPCRTPSNLFCAKQGSAFKLRL